MGKNVPTEEQITVEKLLATLAKRPTDQAAWQEFTHRYDSFIRANVAKAFHRERRQVSDPTQEFREDLVDDLVQAVYVRILGEANQPLSPHKPDCHVHEYLSKLSSNVVRDYFRKAKAPKRPKVTFSLDELVEGRGDARARKEISKLVDPTPTSDRVLVTRDELDHALQKAVTGRHRDRDILIFRLRYYDDLTPGEIQDTLGLELSLASVCSLLHRTGAKLKESLLRERSSATELDSLLARMQTPKFRKAMHAAFNASPDELGRAAVRAARKRR